MNTQDKPEKVTVVLKPIQPGADPNLTTVFIRANWGGVTIAASQKNLAGIIDVCSESDLGITRDRAKRRINNPSIYPGETVEFRFRQTVK